MAFYPGADVSIAGNSGGSYTGGPYKGLLHTTEGSSASGAIGAFKANNSWPHFLIDYAGAVWQFINTNVSARALRNLSGGVQTNRDSVIQIEIVGFAAKPNDHPQVQMDELRELMRWIEATTGVKQKGPGRPFASAYGQNHLRFSNAEWEAFDGWNGHCHAPENCVHPDTPILKSDLTWSRAGDLKVGDSLIGFDEYPEQVGTCPGRRYKESIVEVAVPTEKECMRVTTIYGDVICTTDHPWLVRPMFDGGSRSKVQWVKTKDLKPYHKIFFLGQPWVTNETKMAGYLAGLLDADGHYSSSASAGSWVGFGQVHGPVLDDFCFQVESLGYKIKTFERGIRSDKRSGIIARQPFTDIRIMGGLWESARFLGSIRPPRLLSNFNFNAVVGKTTSHVEVLNIEPVGMQPIISLQTSSKTYIANGMLCHNSHWDPGMINIDYLLSSVTPPPAPVFAVAPQAVTVTRAQGGYMVVQGSDGGVFSYDGAPFFGSLPGAGVTAKVLDAAWTPTGNGYWLLGIDGAIFSFGDAPYHGGFNALPAHVKGNRVPVGIVSNNNGYLVIAYDSSDTSPYDSYGFGT